jgi:hypothetical protein
MKKRIALAAIIAALLIGTAYGTYRYTMNHISISTTGSTAYATVYGQTDIYELDN